MTRRLHLVVFALLIGAGGAPCFGVAPASVSGVVRDSAGIPQIGAEVELLRPDLSVLLSVYTNSSGRFTFPSVLPGRYALKAMGTSFLPSLRENVRVRSNTVVNLTLNTLYEVMQWLPAEPRAAGARQDDWTWTLRSAANRPLLRWLEDGPLVVVSDGSGTQPKLKARLMAAGQQGMFGESGERVSAAVEDTPSNSRELLARVDFDPGSAAGMESMLGLRQDLGFAGSVQSVAAVAIHPEIEAGGAEDLEEAALSGREVIHLGDTLEAEVGSSQVVARFGDHALNTVAATLPFATVGWHEGNATVHYGMATGLAAARGTDEGQAAAWLPELAMRNGTLTLERGLHQEIGWERHTDSSSVAVLVYADHVDDPIIEAMGNFAGQDAEAAQALSGSMLLDEGSGMLRMAGPDYGSAGMQASIERRLPGGNQIRLSYANGNALVMQGGGASAGLPMQAVATAHPRRAQTYALSLSGTLDGTGTRWRASYRWQPEDTVTAIAPFEANADQPYLNVHLTQPIHVRGEGRGGIVAVLDLRNLLAQGYRPYLLNDGSLLVFAQDQRAIQAGLAFTF